MAHLKRYAMPKHIPLPRKTETFIVRAMPGPHKIAWSMPLQVLLRDVLKLAETAAEARIILRAGKVLVDKKPRKEPKFPVGLMDVIEIPELGQQFRIVSGKRGMELEKITGDESKTKLCRILGKTVIKGGVQQLNLSDGRNILAGKKSSYKAGDSVVIGLPGQEILKHYSFEKGTPAFISAGRNIGTAGIIKKAKRKKNMLEKSIVILESGGRDIVTLFDYVFPGDPRAKISRGVKPASTKSAKKTTKPKGGKK